MKKTLLFLFLFFSFASYASENSKQFIFLSKDSIANYPHYLYNDWKFMEGDDSTMALPGYDDSKWKETKTSLYLSLKTTPPFKGIGWFRLHFIADTSVANRPLAMTMTHYGASEIYLDGKLIKSFGSIHGADISEYYDPQERPFIFMIPNAGAHVMAVRYANYKAERNYRVYHQAFAGFKMMIGETALQIQMKDQRSTVLTFGMMLMSGIFFALCLIHLFMFLYYRSVKSNLYFSVFMFCLASLFVICFICYASHWPLFEIISLYLLGPFVILACLTLSGFINDLFGKKKLRFLITSSIGLGTMILGFFESNIAAFIITGLIIGVSFEAVFTVIFGIIRRVRGARIIGAGILFFTLFIIAVYVLAITKGGNVDLNDSTVGGKIFIVILGLAILSIPFSMSVYLAWSFASVNKNLALQLVQVKALSQKTIEQEQEKQRMLENRKEELENEVTKRTAELRDEKKKSDDLLLNILPAEVAEELKTKGSADAKQFDDVTVMFTDFKNFTHISEKLSPSELVAEIHTCFKAFDHIISKHNIEKIKTIGDSYMCAGGLPVANKTNATDVVTAALEIQQFIQGHLQQRIKEGKEPFEIRIGVHTGPVVAGIVGVKKFAYDIWGDTVNLAARMESSGEAGKVNISGATYALVKDKFKCIHRGKIQAKNKGEVEMYFVESISFEIKRPDNSKINTVLE